MEQAVDLKRRESLLVAELRACRAALARQTPDEDPFVAQELDAALAAMEDARCVLGSDLKGEELSRAKHSARFAAYMTRRGYHVVPHPTGNYHWVRVFKGRRLKFSKAYVKTSLGLSPAEQVALVHQTISRRLRQATTTETSDE